MNLNLNSDDYDLLKKMEALKAEDIDAFYNVVFNNLLKFPDAAISDYYPPETRIKALSELLEYFEQLEEYEKCVYIKALIDQIK